jgi:putative lipoic acid-binding regulatory protein
MTADSQELQFPVTWTGRIIGHDLDSLACDLRKALKGLGYDSPVTRGNASQHGRYVTYNTTLTFEDRDTMRMVMHALAQVNGVKMVL